MKMMIEVQGGVVVAITATQECSVYLIDHDNIKEKMGYYPPGEKFRVDLTDVRQAMQPDCITWEEGEDNTPEFDGVLNEALSEYEEGLCHTQ